MLLFCCRRTMRTTTIVLAFALVVIGTIMLAEPTTACYKSYIDYFRETEYGKRFSRSCCGKRCSIIKTGRRGGRYSDIQSCCDSACYRRDKEKRRRDEKWCKRYPLAQSCNWCRWVGISTLIEIKILIEIKREIHQQSHCSKYSFFVRWKISQNRSQAITKP